MESEENTLNFNILDNRRFIITSNFSLHSITYSIISIIHSICRKYFQRNLPSSSFVTRTLWNKVFNFLLYFYILFLLLFYFAAHFILSLFNNIYNTPHCKPASPINVNKLRNFQGSSTSVRVLTDRKRTFNN